MDSSDLSLEYNHQQLKAVLEEKDAMLTQAAQFGQQLLETNKELEQQLEENTKSSVEKIECLEQEKHSLQLKLNCQTANLASVQQELETLQTQLEDRHSDEIRRLEEISQRRVHEDAQTNASLKTEVDKLEAQLRILTEKYNHSEETVRQLREDASAQGNSTFLQHELNDLETLLLEEHDKNEALSARVLEAEGYLEVVSVEREGLLSKVAALEEECQERCRLSNEWFENLKDVKEQNLAIKSELDLLKMEKENGFYGSKGNSLFGEVEDKRVEAERKLISLQVRHESLEKMHSLTKQRYTRLEAKMSALFCRYNATTADSDHVQRLKRALSQSQNENEGLRNKIHKLETQLADSTSVQDRRKLMSAFVDFGDKAEYIQLLEQEIDQAKSQYSALLAEMDIKRTQLVWESNKLSEAESKLYHCEQQHARKREDLTKLRIRLQESSEKLNQANTKIAQLEADKTFLEGELKSRRGRKSLAPRPPTNQTDHPCSSTRHCDQSNELLTDSNDRMDTACTGLKESNGELPKSTSSDKVTQQPERVINLLEELETEFSRQKSTNGVMNGQQQRGVENTVPTCKVINVNNKKTEQQCAQQ